MPYRYRDRLPGITDFESAAQAFGSTHRYGAYDTVAELLLHFQRQAFGLGDQKRIVNLGNSVSGKFYETLFPRFTMRF